MAGWTAFGLFMATEWYIQATKAHNPVSWGTVLFSEMIYAYTWLLLTPAILWFAWKVPIQAPGWIRAIHLHLVATIVFTFLHRFLYNVLIEAASMSAARPFAWENVVGSLTRYLDYGIMIYWILVLSRQAVVYYRELQHQALAKSRLEAQLNLAQLRALKMQLQPHFLFNTLNGISVLVRKDPDLACSMIARLGDLLRMTLDNTGAQEVPLDQELRILQCYLEIEQMRYADRLNVVLEIEEEAKQAFVPNLILQPLVENALRHGISKQRGPSTIRIKAWKENGSLGLRVDDSGPGIGDGEPLREGIGLTNTRSRLAQLYPERFSFSIESILPTGASARILLPYHTVALP
jgi:LytS/YehU family sensor histidine kinase